MRYAAVLGSPVSHSLSPLIHNAGYRALGLDNWRYDAHECGQAELESFLDELSPDWAGLSLTMPLKEVALGLADSVSPMAQALGAVNTLVLDQQGRHADNTDAPGMVDALAEVGMVRVDQVAILGAGGTARAALGAASALGASHAVVYARRRDAIAELEPVAARLGLPLQAADWDDAERAAEASLVVSTMPKGVADSLAPQWKPETVLFDVLYDPWPTPLAVRAADAGCRVVGGEALLLWQAVIQFERFTGQQAPVEAMRRAMAERRR